MCAIQPQHLLPHMHAFGARAFVRSLSAIHTVRTYRNVWGRQFKHLQLSAQRQPQSATSAEQRVELTFAVEGIDEDGADDGADKEAGQDAPGCVTGVAAVLHRAAPKQDSELRPEAGGIAGPCRLDCPLRSPLCFFCKIPPTGLSGHTSSKEERELVGAGAYTPPRAEGRVRVPRGPPAVFSN